MKAVILARVSTLRQEKEGLSLQDIQLPDLREYAKKKGFEIAQEFTFSESADNKIRRKFTEMIDFVKQNNDIKVIIAYRVDRMTRNYRDAVLIDELRLEHDKEIHFVHDRLVISKNTSGRDIQDWDLKVFLAKQYLNRLKDDAKASAMRKLENGEWPLKAPYGYKNITREDKKKWIEVEPFQSEVVKKMYEWYSTGSYSLLEVKDKANETFNLSFSKGYVDFLLKHPFFCGTMVYDGKEYPHGYETFIPQELFDKVQEIKAGYNKKHFKFAGLPYLYRGLIRCAECGRIVTPEKKKGKYVYYHCTQYYGKHNAPWIREEDLTSQFAELFSSINLPKDVVEDIAESLKSSHKDKVHFTTSLMTNYQTEYKKYEKRIGDMYEDKLDGSITKDYFEEKRKEYRAKQKGLEKKMEKLRNADEQYYLSSEYLLNVASRASELFKSSEPHEKRQLLKMTLQNLVLDGKTARFDWIKPFDKIAYYASRQAWLPG